MCESRYDISGIAKNVLKLWMLASFWMIILPSYFGTVYFVTPEYGEMIREFVTDCATPSVEDLFQRLVTMFVVNVAYCAAIRNLRMTPRIYSVVSAGLGIAILYASVGLSTAHLAMLFLFICWIQKKIGQWLLRHDHTKYPPMYMISSFTVGLLVVGELIFPDRIRWSEARGMMMIMAMKLISIATEDFYLLSIKNTEFFGYMLCPPTLLFGPWIKIGDYRMHKNQHQPITWKWALKLIQIVTYAMIFMVTSNCINYSFLFYEGKFLQPTEHMRYALAFRSSNYFVCYMAEWSMLLAGFCNLRPRRRGDWEYPVCKPRHVEFPRSLAMVVRNWNIPFHNFLKNYIYIPYLNSGQAGAMIITFFFSALLHGMNLRLSIVLLTLGMLGMAQKDLMDKCADWISACVKVNDCKPDCRHKYGFYHPLSLLINAVNMGMNITHLIYLGYIMDDRYAELKWWELYSTWDHDFGLFTHNTAAIMCGIAMFW